MQIDLWHQRIWQLLCELIKAILRYRTGKQHTGIYHRQRTNFEGNITTFFVDLLSYPVLCLNLKFM